VFSGFDLPLISSNPCMESNSTLGVFIVASREIGSMAIFLNFGNDNIGILFLFP
jgi:hypothetical protein